MVYSGSMNGILITGESVLLSGEAASSLNIEDKDAILHALRAYLWLLSQRGAVVLSDAERKKLIRGENPWS